MAIWLSLLACGLFGANDEPDAASVDADGDGAVGSVDCDDDDPTRAPGLAEVCDGIDNDCDDLVDEEDLDSPPPGLISTFADADGDGFGDRRTEEMTCDVGEGRVTDSRDCDDGNADRAPGLPEVCDGIDNDCDDLVDDEDLDSPPRDRSTFYTDEDEDGYGVSGAEVVACVAPEGFADNDEDCDDDRPDRAPGLDELCDGVDNDCDNLVDDEDIDSTPVDAATWFRDADRDGYGDAAVTATSCLAPVDFVTDATDCDDRDPAVAPGAFEACDGIDNDCDNVVDVNVVPRDFATTSDAVDAAPTLTPTTICVWPGTYPEPPFALVDKSIAIVSSGGSAATTLDLSAVTGRFAVAVGDSALAFEGFTVTGLDNQGTTGAVDGAFAAVLLDPSATPAEELVLRDLVFVAPQIRAAGTLTGGMVRLENADARLEDVEVRDLDATHTGPTVLEGAVLASEAGSLRVSGLTFTDPVLATSGISERCVVEGGLVHAVGDADTELDTLTVSGGSFAFDCQGDAFAIGSAVFVQGGTFTGSDWTLEDNTVEVRGRAPFGYGLIFRDSGNAIVQGADVRDNTIHAIGQADITYALGSLTLGFAVNDAVVSGLIGSGNLVLAEGPPMGSQAYGTVLASISSAEMTLLSVDLRANAALADLAFGGAVYTQANTLTVLDAVFAGNLAGGPTASGGYGGALLQSLVSPPQGATDIRYADFVGNRAEGTLESRGGAVAIRSPTTTVLNQMRHVNLVDNEVMGPTASGSAVEAEDPLGLSYSNLFGNLGADPVSSTILGDPVLSVDPMYVDVSGADPRTWDLRLQPGSPLIDAGSPSETDPDGTRRDIGSRGGPTVNVP